MAVRKVSKTKRASISKRLKTSAKAKRIHVIPQKGEWAVKRETAKRASAVVKTQKKAVDAAKAVAKAKPVSTILVHGKDGTIIKSIPGVSTTKKTKTSRKTSSGKK